jgi:hypothetical protein
MSARRRPQDGSPSSIDDPEAFAAKLIAALSRERGPARAGFAEKLRVLLLNDRRLSAITRARASAALTPAEFRGAKVGLPRDFKPYEEALSERCRRPRVVEHFNPRRTATIDGGDRRWTEDDVASMLDFAARVVWSEPFPSCEVPSTKVAFGLEIARTAQELWELCLYGLDKPHLRRPLPVSSELRIRDLILPWFYAIEDPRKRMVLFLRSQGSSYGAIAKRMKWETPEGKGISRTTARDWYGECLRDIVKVLNAPTNRRLAAA